MAITRSQIARQLLADGGVSLDDAKMMAPPGEFLAYINPKEADMLRAAGGSGIMTPMGIPSFVDFTGYSQSAADTLGASAFEGTGGTGRGSSQDTPDSDPTTMDDTRTVNLGLDVSRGPALTPPDPDEDTSFFSNPGKALSIRYIENELDRRKNFENTFAGKLGFTPNETPFDDKFLSRTQELEAALNLAKRGINVTDIIQKGRPGYNENRGGDSEPVIKLRAPITEKIEEKSKLSDIENLLRLRGSAFEDGGQVRKGYLKGGLSKVFKKAKKAASKVFKSPIGKAALFAGLGAYGLGAGPFSSGKFGAGFLKSEGFKKFLLANPDKAFSLGNLSPFSLIGIPTVASYLMAKKDEGEDETLPEVNNTDPAFTNLINYMGGSTRFAANGGDIDEAPIKMASAPDPAADRRDVLEELSLKYYKKPLKDLTPDEFLDLENAIDEMSKKQGIQRTMAAMGGIMNPNDEMLDLGGNEMDLRGGGFVPLGEYEKKDDVPARLSKNEFVFTADAVRAAGGGSVDRGADLMYKTMKQLENKVV